METALSDIEIANTAMDGLGVERIESFDDLSEQARAFKSVFTMFRDDMLACHPWNFATDRAALGKLATSPVWEYANAFQLPEGCLRVLATDVDEDGYAWVRSGDKLLSDVDTIKIKYIKRVIDPTQMSPGFLTAFAAKLEAELAYKLTGNADIAKLKTTVALEKLRLAKAMNSQEGRSLKNMQNDAWINARNTGQIS